jgi:hypothetical protein
VSRVGPARLFRTVTSMRGALSAGRLWPLALAVTLLLAGLLPLVWESRYYYSGDTQVAYLGWWFRLGEEVRAGHWPLLDVQSWRAGNAIAEGQWGLFSPLSVAIGVLASVAPNVVTFLTVVKIALVVVSGLGVYLLVRSYRVPRPAAFVAGLLAPLSGQSQYGDWPSWAAGLMVTALVPWAWWGIRRVMAGAHPLPALVCCYLVVTIGYVYGTLYLALVCAGCLLECALARNRAALVRVFGIGCVSALVAVAVYLPGILTSPVTIRSAWVIVGHGIWTVDPATLFSSVLPVVQVHGEIAVNRYVTWVIPLLVWVDWGRLRRQWRELSALLFTTGVLLVWVLGPNRMGPIRWPLRVLPAFTLMLVVLLVVVLVRTSHRPPGRIRLMLSLGWVVGAFAVVTVRLGQVEAAPVAGALVVGVLLVMVWAAVRGKGLGPAAVVAALGTLAVLVTQHAVVPDPPSQDRQMPARAVDYRQQLSTAVGDTFMVGDPSYSWRDFKGASRELLIGSTWYLNGHPVHNAGTAISYRDYDDRFCIDWSGSTCPTALDELFARSQRTRQRWVDLMSVSTLLIARGVYRQHRAAGRLADPPPGWHVSDVGRWSRTWVRDTPLPTAGGPVWTSSGTRVSALSSTDRDVSFRVEQVPRGGGEVVLSRLAWPGYQVHGDVPGARLSRPVGGMLISVDLPPNARGRTVTLHYAPPSWWLAIGCWWLAIGLAALWSVLSSVRRRRTPGPATGNAGVQDQT